MTGSGEGVVQAVEADAWERFVQALPLAEVCTQTVAPLEQVRLDWAVAGIRATADDLDDRRRFAALLTAVPPAVARCFAEAIGWDQRVPTGAARRLEHYLAAVSEVAPKVSLRAGVGWAVVAGAAVGVEYDILAMPLDEDAARAKPIVAPWVGAGLAETGWVYAAAGLTPEEALAGLGTQALVEQDVRALAALRGVPLPAFTD